MSIERWSESLSFRKTWNVRTAQMLSFEPNAKSYLDVGAGKCYLSTLMKDGQRYVPLDMVDRSEYYDTEPTIIMDLNKDEWNITERFDVVFASGLFEYIHDVQKLIELMASITDTVICSYADTFKVKDDNNHGWVNHYTQVEFCEMFDNVGFTIEISERWKNQQIYLFRRNL